jgi:hypothetical protein
MNVSSTWSTFDRTWRSPSRATKSSKSTVRSRNRIWEVAESKNGRFQNWKSKSQEPRATERAAMTPPGHLAVTLQAPSER